MKTIAQEIIVGTYEDWPCKIQLPTSNLSVKYVILNMIGVENWAPTNHNSDITTSLPKLIYKIGTRVSFDFGTYVFEQVLKQNESYAIKLPISFPTLIFGILISQRLDIINSEDVEGASDSPLNFSYPLFARTNEGDLPEVPLMPGTVISNVLLELALVSKSLQEVIVTSTVHKNKVDELIQRMVPKGVKAFTTQLLM